MASFAVFEIATPWLWEFGFLTYDSRKHKWSKTERIISIFQLLIGTLYWDLQAETSFASIIHQKSKKKDGPKSDRLSMSTSALPDLAPQSPFRETSTSTQSLSASELSPPPGMIQQPQIVQDVPPPSTFSRPKSFSILLSKKKKKENDRSSVGFTRTSTTISKAESVSDIAKKVTLPQIFKSAEEGNLESIRSFIEEKKGNPFESIKKDIATYQVMINFIIFGIL
jgi:hypothetical protein